MKSISRLLLTALFLAIACTNPDTPAETPGEIEDDKPEVVVESIGINGPKSISAAAEGGKQTLAVSASVDWIARTSADWLTITPSAGEKGDCQAEVAISVNDYYDARSGYIAFAAGAATDTVFVSQAGADYLIVEPDSFQAKSEGGQFSSIIKSNLEPEWNVEEDAGTWLNVEGSASENPGWTLSITVSPLEDVHGRSGKIIVRTASDSAEIIVRQSGVTPVLTVSASNRQCPAAGESFSVPVTTNLEISVSTPDWISATRTDAGYDFTVSANESDNLRSGRVSISNAEFSKSASFTVSQKSPRSMYILAIGNSFSWDAMEYLYQILQNLGYKDIFLGNLYIGGCTLQTHAYNITNDKKAYEFRTNGNGSWSSTSSYSAITAMKGREWDFVSMQQASGSSGMADTYEPYLSTVADAVKQYCPAAKRMWHMTWAYQGNSNHSEFYKYGNDQMTMYNAILNAVQTKVLSRGDFDFVIPCGTAVQNLRTSFLGDNITRDGYHMSFKTGRFLTGLMWARQITGESVSGVNYKPSGYSYSEDEITVIKDAVENAYNKPYEVTESSIPPHYVYASDELKSIFTGAGYSIDDYTSLGLVIEHKAFYNSTSSSTMTSAAAGSTASNITQFAATQIFRKADIPSGSVIVLKQGFQYRPEGWTELSATNTQTSRPGNVVASADNSVVPVNDGWWGSWNYRAFNIAKAGNPNLDEAGQQSLEGCFAIFVPKNR